MSVYRRKFITYTAVVLIISILLFFLTSAYFVSVWTREQQLEADAAFERCESEIKQTKNKLDSYMERLYAETNTRLRRDFRWFLDNDAQGYLSQRLRQSHYDETLISFPDDIRYFLSGTAVSRISLHGKHYANIIHLTERESMSFDFQIPNEHAMFTPNITEGFLYNKLIGDILTSAHSERSISFLIDSNIVFRTVSDYQVDNIYLTSEEGKLYQVVDHEDIPDAVLGEIKEIGNNNGALRKGFFRYHYKIRPSSQFDYAFIDIVSERSIIKERSNSMVFFLAIFLLLDIGILSLLYVNLRQEAKFLSEITQTMNRVMVGDFTSAVSKELPKGRTGRGEYQLIASELDTMTRQLEQYIEREYLLKLEQKEVEMQAFQHQINPHFLYNTLEIIRASALTHGQNTVADSIATLGSLYRKIIREIDPYLLENEIELLQDYLEIMELRYPKIFYYQFDVPEHLQKTPTVKLWLQPLAENFFIHGFDTDTPFNLLLLNAFEQEGFLVVEMIDNGSFIAKEKLEEINNSFSPEVPAKPGSIGLKNVYQRLSLFYGDRVFMKVENNEQAGIKITVKIPLEEVEPYV